MSYATPGAPVGFILHGGQEQWLGQLTFRLDAVTGGPGTAATTDGVAWVNDLFVASCVAPGPGVYRPVWSYLGTETTADELLTVNSLGAGPVVPSAAEIRARSRAAFAEYGYAEPASGEPDPLEPLIAEAAAEFQGALGVAPDSLPQGWVATLATKALRIWVEYLAAANQPELIDMSADFEVLSTTSHGRSVSEGRRMPGADRNNLHPWPPLDRILWQIRNAWEAMDAVPDVPAVGAPTTIPKPGDWIMRQRHLLYGANGSIYGDLPPIGGVARYLIGGA